jgi:Ca2+/Na+ antiporter
MKYILEGRNLFIMLLASVLIRFVFVGYINEENPEYLRLIFIFVILISGAIFGLRMAANIIEETTGVISVKTKLAGGLLQSLGTAFPDMILGVIAAIMSLQLKDVDAAKSLSFAIIAASTTFGSNIYNIAHAFWCVWRQNKANTNNKVLLMFPFFSRGGTVKPFSQHETLPVESELNIANRLLEILSLLTGAVAISMVAFGKTNIDMGEGFGDVYQLKQLLGLVLVAICIFILWKYRKTERLENTLITSEEKSIFEKTGIWFSFFSLFLAGIAILFCAESMVKSLEAFSHITNVSSAVTGLAAGIIGCLGEMIVIHNFTVHPRGRIGDAVVGVAMDNIVTLFGAGIVALIGGIFLGSDSLIIIFMLIFCLNILLIRQIENMKDRLTTLKNSLPVNIKNQS